MGFLDRFFSKESKEERFVKKHVSRVLSKYSQKELREESMHALAQRGTPDAIYGLLQRFTFNHPESIVDEKEKHKVISLLEILGKEFVGEPLRKYLHDPRQTELAMALIALERLEGETATWLEIISMLDDSEPDDNWTADRKLQMVNHLDKYNTAEVIPPLVRFLNDINDDVVFRCIDILENIADDDQIREAFVLLACDENTSMRIRARILETIRGRKWFVGPHRKKLEPVLPEGYYFDKRDNIKKRE